MEKSIVRIDILLPTPIGTRRIDVDAVMSDVPLLLGIDVMDRKGLFFNTVENMLNCAPGEWAMPVICRIFDRTNFI